MRGLNKVTLIGNLGKDPEVKVLEGNVAVAKFSLATTESFRDKSGQMQSHTDWHTIVLWRGLAELAQAYLRKGSLVYVEGKISYRKYTGQDGVERNVTDIVSNTFRILDRKEGVGESRFPASEPTTMRANGSNGTESSLPSADVSVAADGGDGLPF